MSVSAQAVGWGSAASMTSTHRMHTATLLPSGKVLVAGGRDSGGNALSSAELYDPASNTWATTGNLVIARQQHTATLLPSGMVLVVGGFVSGVNTNITELYDPANNTWTTTGSLAKARWQHTATLLPSGKVLVAGGAGLSGSLNSAELYDPASNTWTTMGSLGTARYAHSATLLSSGKVLVAAGSNSSGALNSAELYEPGNNTWTTTGSLGTARDSHSATLLTSGKVMVAGGYRNASGGGAFSSAELYDPVNNTWSTTGSLGAARYRHSATLLPSGRVLVAGGTNASGNLVGGAELFDPVNNTWGAAGSLGAARLDHTATLLTSGKVLVAGGFGQVGILNSAELYDPAINSWNTTGGTLAAARQYHTATLLPSGKILVVGGNNSSGSLASAELYDPATGSTGAWSPAGNLTTARLFHTATLLPSGKVLVVGGRNSSGAITSAELYDPAATGSTNPWSSAGNLTTARYNHTATLLPSGKILVAGGYNFDSGALTSAELYDPAATGSTSPWSLAGNLTTARYLHTATLLPSGKVLVAGGADNNGNAVTSAELYDPAVMGSTNLWSSAGNLTTARFHHTATLLPSGKVLVAGGYNNSDGFLAGAELYDTATGAWSSAGNSTTARFHHTATLLPSGEVMVVGGFNSSSGALTSAELYDPAATGSANPWSPAGNLTTARYHHTATLLPSGKVLVAGGYGTGGALASAELYLYDLGIVDTRRPVITTVNSPLTLGSAITVTGTGFTGDSEASGGSTSSSATNVPLLQLRRMDNEQIVWTSPAPLSTRSATSYQSSPLSNLPTGPYLLTVYVNALASTSTMLMIVKANQSISGFTPTTPVAFGATAQTLTAVKGASSSPLVFSLTSGPCTLSTATLSYTGAGSCVVAVNQAADANYSAAPQVSATVDVTRASQTIVFGSPPSLLYQGSAALTATGGASGIPVIFSSTTPTVCTVSGATVTDVTAGSCVVAANQAGNGNFSAATQVTQSFVVARMSSQSTLSSLPNPPSPGLPLTLLFTVTPVASGIVSNAALNQPKSAIAAAAVPTGTATFSDNGVVLGTVALDANGQANYTIAALSSGRHSFTATYSGDSIVAPSSALLVLDVAAIIVPTLSGWMLLLLALLLGAAALRVRLRRD